jgi:hypothetical protein
MSDEAARIDIGGVTFNQGPDIDGVVWSCGGITGWHGSPTQVEVVDPTGSNGGVEVERRAPARSVVVPGSVWAPTQELAWEAHRVIANSMPGRMGAGVMDFYETVPKRLRIKQGVRPELPSPAAGTFEFLLTLLALDPFKTGLTPTVVTIAAGATEDVVNAGDEAAYVSVETTGAGTVWLRQDDSGAVMRSKAAVASGVVFDALTRTVTPSVQMLAPSQWLSLAAESTTPFTNLGTAPLLLTVFDTYG